MRHAYKAICDQCTMEFRNKKEKIDHEERYHKKKSGNIMVKIEKRGETDRGKKIIIEALADTGACTTMISGDLAR